MEYKSSINPLHYKYIITILVLAIIVLMIFFFTKDKTLVDYVSFGATLSSLILAILAIIQGFVSNNSLSDTISDLKRSSIQIENNSTDLTTLMAEFDKKFKEVPDQLKTISMKYDEFLALITPNTQPPGTPLNFSLESVTSIVNNNSPIGNLALYAAYLSATKDKAFDFSKLISDDDEYKYYIIGNLVAYKSIGLFKIKSEGYMITISDVKPEMNVIIDKVETLKTQNPKGFDYKEIKDRIDNMFN
ncbi:hypothetical protein [Mucilaginibacter jinjuensis]|uniref:Uncharacterized protein n=1 Tax=Mucilaginibacter jinjuensis TaxID=1176721 RepID=A0ABY7T7L0_9SPHI|nr:hypothetical protein [Mucilaginibacter jinjuensis]WCT12470.1 hypothetical protein PQO05_00810 [Mucilaginibacter jinjuensis]